MLDNMPQDPKIVKVEELPATEAKWIEFQKISWQGKKSIDTTCESYTDLLPQIKPAKTASGKPRRAKPAVKPGSMLSPSSP